MFTVSLDVQLIPLKLKLPVDVGEVIEDIQENVNFSVSAEKSFATLKVLEKVDPFISPS